MLGLKKEKYKIFVNTDKPISKCIPKGKGDRIIKTFKNE